MRKRYLRPDGSAVIVNHGRQRTEDSIRRGAPGLATHVRLSRKLPDVNGPDGKPLLKNRRETFGGQEDLISRVTMTVRTADPADRQAFREFLAKTGMEKQVVQRWGARTVDRMRGWTRAQRITWFRKHPGVARTMTVYETTAYVVVGPWEFLERLSLQPYVVHSEFRNTPIPFNLPGAGPEARRVVRPGVIPNHENLREYYPAAERVIRRPPVGQGQTKAGRLENVVRLNLEHQTQLAQTAESRRQIETANRMARRMRSSKQRLQAAV